MKGNYTFELPERLRVKLSKAVRLEWITLGYLITVVIAMYLVMGSSQAMKSAWLEDVLSLIPSLVFLILPYIINILVFFILKQRKCIYTYIFSTLPFF